MNPTTATYTTREGVEWRLRDLRPDEGAPGFWWAVREADQARVCVHRHGMTFQAALPVSGPPSPLPSPPGEGATAVGQPALNPS